MVMDLNSADESNFRDVLQMDAWHGCQERIGKWQILEQEDVSGVEKLDGFAVDLSVDEDDGR